MGGNACSTDAHAGPVARPEVRQSSAEVSPTRWRPTNTGGAAPRPAVRRGRSPPLQDAAPPYEPAARPCRSRDASDPRGSRPGTRSAGGEGAGRQERWRGRAARAEPSPQSARPLRSAKGFGSQYGPHQGIAQRTPVGSATASAEGEIIAHPVLGGLATTIAGPHDDLRMDQVASTRCSRCRSRRSRCADPAVHLADPRVHDDPILLFTMRRSWRSRSAETRSSVVRPENSEATGITEVTWSASWRDN